MSLANVKDIQGEKIIKAGKHFKITIKIMIVYD